MVEIYEQKYIVKSYDELTQEQIDDIPYYLENDKFINEKRNIEEDYLFDDMIDDIYDDSFDKCGYNVMLDSQNKGFKAENGNRKIIKCKLNDKEYIVIIPEEFEFDKITTNPLMFAMNYYDVRTTDGDYISGDSWELFEELYKTNSNLKKVVDKIYKDMLSIGQQYNDLLYDYETSDLYPIEKFIEDVFPSLLFKFEVYDGEEEYIGCEYGPTIAS